MENAVESNTLICVCSVGCNFAEFFGYFVLNWLSPDHPRGESVQLSNELRFSPLSIFTGIPLSSQKQNAKFMIKFFVQNKRNGNG